MGAHVLLVEDSALVVSALRVLLEDGGFRVSAASTVRAALAAAAAAPPDVLLLDLSLPDGNGLSVLEQLAAAGSAPRVTVALTGRDEPEVRARCLAAGCRDVLVKPMNPSALPKQIAAWLAELADR